MGIDLEIEQSLLGLLLGPPTGTPTVAVCHRLTPGMTHSFNSFSIAVGCVAGPNARWPDLRAIDAWAKGWYDRGWLITIALCEAPGLLNGDLIRFDLCFTAHCAEDRHRSHRLRYLAGEK